MECSKQYASFMYSFYHVLLHSGDYKRLLIRLLCYFLLFFKRMLTQKRYTPSTITISAVATSARSAAARW